MKKVILFVGVLAAFGAVNASAGVAQAVFVSAAASATPSPVDNLAASIVNAARAAKSNAEASCGSNCDAASIQAAIKAAVAPLLTDAVSSGGMSQSQVLAALDQARSTSGLELVIVAALAAQRTALASNNNTTPGAFTTSNNSNANAAVPPPPAPAGAGSGYKN